MAPPHFLSGLLRNSGFSFRSKAVGARAASFRRNRGSHLGPGDAGAGYRPASLTATSYFSVTSRSVKNKRCWGRVADVVPRGQEPEIHRAPGRNEIVVRQVGDADIRSSLGHGT